jgi:hypothetical protein
VGWDRSQRADHDPGKGGLEQMVGTLNAHDPYLP